MYAQSQLTPGRNRPRWHRAAGTAALLAACDLLLGSTAGAATTRTEVDAFQPIQARYPKTCKQTVTGMSGLCLIGSSSLKPKNRFLVTQANAAGQPIGNAQVAPYNQFLRLNPGRYLLASDSGIDSLHEFKLTIYPGALTSVQTGTVRFSAGSKAHRLQHYQSENGINGRGCAAVLIKSGVQAVLPGNYQVNPVDKKSADAAPTCLNTGVTFNVLAGKALSGTPRRVADQSPLAGNQTYRHPDGVSSLASMSRFQADIERLGYLKQWKSYRGIHNPHGRAYDALVLSGIGAQQFVVPFTWRGKRRECGLSLAEAGLPSHVLMTDCVFRGKTLTSFRVNPGSYYTLNNRHGKTAIEGNYINNPILVQNVRFALK
ncbi:MAG: hypothetical protein ACKN9W_03070 [Methylococcus sp.]